MAKKSVELNKLTNQINIYNVDMKNFVTSDTIENYDLIVCNPPYFKINEKNFLNLSIHKQIARHELEITLSDIFCISKKLLTNNGNLVVVHRTTRLLEIFDLYRKNGIEPKRVQFVYEKANKESTLVLVEGQKGGKPGLKIEKPFILYNEDGTITSEYDNLCKEVRK